MPTPIKKTKEFFIQLQSANSPDLWVAPCSFNSETGLEFTATTIDGTTIDCEAPNDPVWLDPEIDTLSASISGAGQLDTESLAVWQAWWDSKAAKTVRIQIDESAGDGGGYWSGDFLLTTWGVTKSGRGYAEFSATLTSKGEITWTAAT